MSVTTDVRQRRDVSGARTYLGAWVLLVALTGISVWLLRSEGAGASTLLNCTILVVTFLKIFVIMMVFMNVRRASATLRMVCSTWCAGVCAILVVGVLVSA